MPLHRITAAAAALLVSGCGGSSAVADSRTRPLPSYLARYPQKRPIAVYFVQWQRAGESIDGTLTIVPAGGAATSARTQSFTGQIDGRSVELEIGTETRQRWTGELQGRRMVLTAELEGGPSQTLTFTRANLAAYKRAVAELQG